MFDEFISRHCPLCRSKDSQLILTDNNRREGLPISSNLVECIMCDMHYLNPVPTEKIMSQLYHSGFIDPVAIIPINVRPVSKKHPKIKHLRKVAHFINGRLRGHPHDWPDEEGQGRSILDFGCHDGSKLSLWYQRGWRVAGIDLNQQAIEAARQRFIDGQFWCGDLLNLDINDRFDFIRSDNVLEHLLDPVAYLQALVRLLNPGGQIRIFVPNGAALSVRLFGRYSAVFWMPFHLNLFTTHTLKILLNKVGLKNITCSTYAPVGSWTWTQRQLFLQPGFNHHMPSHLDRMIKMISILNYPGEIMAQWAGYGEELVATGQKSN